MKMSNPSLYMAYFSQFPPYFSRFFNDLRAGPPGFTPLDPFLVTPGYIYGQLDRDDITR